MEKIDVMLLPLRGFLQQIGDFLPRLGIALVVLFVGWLIAKGFRFSVVKALRALNFHIVTERAGIDGYLTQGGSRKDVTDWIGVIGYALVLLASLIIAFNSLGLTQVTDLLGRMLLFVPRLLVALLVVVFGGYFARFVGGAVQRYFRSAGISDADLLGRIARYAVMTFVILLAVDHLDIGGALIQQTFLILLAGVVLALALAFGLGARDRAAELLDRWFPRDRADSAPLMSANRSPAPPGRGDPARAAMQGTAQALTSRSVRNPPSA